MLQSIKSKSNKVAKTEAIHKEFILSSHSGAWSYSTLAGCNTRKEHGLFVYRIPAFNNNPFVLLASLNESLIKQGEALPLNTKPRLWNEINQGNAYFRSGDYSSQIISVVYHTGDVQLKKEILFMEGENRLLIKYTLLPGSPLVWLRAAPLLAFRGINEVTFANTNCNRLHGTLENGVSFKMYAQFPSIHIQCSNKVHYQHTPHYLKGFQYYDDRGNKTETEDLFNPGLITTKLAPGSSTIIQVSLHPTDTRALQTIFQSQTQKIEKNNSTNAYLTEAARQFMAAKEKQYYLISSLPYKVANATEVFKSLPGLKIALKNCHTCISAEHNLIAELKRRLENVQKPRLTSGFENPQLLFWACWSFLSIPKKDELTSNYYMDLVVQIILVIRKNKIAGLKLNKDGLVKFTKTNEKESKTAVKLRPRKGYLIEINSIWYNAVKCAEMYVEDSALKNSLHQFASTIHKAFIKKFWNDEQHCLFDYVDKNWGGNEIRSNMLFAISQKFTPLDQKQQRQVLDTISTHLLTPVGLRSLSPANDYYAGKSISHENPNLLNGSAELWLMASYATALIKNKGLQGYERIAELVTDVEQMVNQNKGMVPHYFTGNPPFSPIDKTAGLLAVAETARLLETVKTCKRHLANNPNATNFENQLFNKVYST